MTFISPTRRSPQLKHGLTLSYFEWGQGGEPILLLHGLADHGLVWSQLGEYLTTKYPGKYHIVALDLRGHGESAKPETGYACDNYIEDFQTLFEHLGWSQTHILGHSWAGKFLRDPKYIEIMTFTRAICLEFQESGPARRKIRCFGI